MVDGIEKKLKKIEKAGGKTKKKGGDPPSLAGMKHSKISLAIEEIGGHLSHFVQTEMTVQIEKPQLVIPAGALVERI